MEHIPTVQELAGARPDLTDIESVNSGSFKAVFKVAVGQGFEAVKVIYIPPAAEEDSTREEIAARVRREIEALRLCKSDRLVKLGSLQLEPLSISQRDYLI